MRWKSIYEDERVQADLGVHEDEPMDVVTNVKKEVFRLSHVTSEVEVFSKGSHFWPNANDHEAKLRKVIEIVNQYLE